MESTNSKKEHTTQSTNENTMESSSKKPALLRKPSIKRKAPEVKQTLTSYRRMLKANPLLKYENEGKDILIPKNSNLDSNSEVAAISVDSRSSNKNEVKKPIQRSQSQRTYTTAPRFLKKYSLISGNVQCLNKKTHNLNISRQSNIDFNQSQVALLSSTKLDKKTPKVKQQQCPNASKAFPKPSSRTHSKENHCLRNGTEKIEVKVTSKNEKKIEKPKIKINGNSEKPPLRRSLSAQHLYQNKIKQFNPCLAYTKADRTQSLEEISKDEPPKHVDFSPIAEENRSKEHSFLFKTPSAYERRSVAFFTPHSVNRKSVLRTSTPSMPTNMQLQNRLNDWLKKRGKSLSSFHHLKCFGIHHKPVQEPTIDEENKENVEVEIPDRASYEDLNIDQKNDEEKEVISEVVAKMVINPEAVALEALSDLLTLIKEGYPREQCEAWLCLIKEKHTKLEEQSLYWECRAALEQSIGNIANAVECYRTAIVQGAEIQNVDRSLDLLLQKFSLLNINTNNPKDKQSLKEKERIIREARNVFKSSIIQFAVQERKMKKNDSIDVNRKLVATPVRRSTRLSRSRYTKTPGVQICSSLIEFEEGKVDFHKNPALC